MTVDASGEAYAVPVPGWRLTETAARIAARLALASEADGCFFIYTPSANPGMAILGREDNHGQLAQVLAKAVPNNLFARAKLLAKQWMARMLSTPEEIAGTRGMLMVEAVDLKPETFLENLDAMSPKEFAAAIEEYRSADAVVVEGR